MTPYRALTAALVAGTLGITLLHAATDAAMERSSAQAKLADTLGALRVESAALEREQAVSAHWQATATGYATQVRALKAERDALDIKYTDLLNRHADDQWRIWHLENATALQPAWLTAAWPLIRCESTYRADVVSVAVIDGVAYEQLGLMQLLWDAAMQQVAHELGYTRDDLLRAGPNLHTAAVYAQRTARGVPFRKWGCK